MVPLVAKNLFVKQDKFVTEGLKHVSMELFLIWKIVLKQMNVHVFGITKKKKNLETKELGVEIMKTL